MLTLIINFNIGNLRIEMDNVNIYFKLKKLNESIDYIYKNKFKITSFINILELNPNKYSNYELILKIFDKLYNKNIIIIDEIDEDNINMKIKYSILYDDIEKEIKLYKEYMNINDKINIMYNQLKLININNNNELKKENEEMRKEINQLKLKLNKKENNNINLNENMINEIIDKKIDKIINNYNIKDKDKKIIELNNKIINQENEIKNKNKEIELINKKLENINNILNNYQNNINNLNQKINENNNNNKNEKYFNDKIKEEKENIINNINNKYNELKEIINKKIEINDLEKINEYEKKINYKFIKEPQNLKYKYDIINTNIKYGYGDIFEIFISYKDNKEYIISPNNNNNNLDIFSLIDNKKILSLKGHNNTIRTIRYFINIKNEKEYLISADKNKIVIIWDITNNYNILYNINTNYKNTINSCLLIFSNNDNNNYIITSTNNISKDIDKSSTKIYSLNNGKFIKYINNSNKYNIFYLLSWYNDNKYYIIEFANNKIVINNLLEDKLYSELIQQPEDNHYSGFIKNKDNKDYLYSSSNNGYINIWDLYNKNIFKIINTNNCKLYNIIEWNNKYIMVADCDNKSFKIIDIEAFKVISDINGIHKKDVKSIKKIYHPIYGESLLSSDEDGIIKLWNI